MDWNPFDWFRKTEYNAGDNISLVTPFGHFKDRRSLLNFCYNKWQSLDGVYYYPDFNSFCYFTTKLSELGGICEYKEHHDNDIYKMFIKPNCSNSVKVVYFGKKDDSNMNAGKRLRKDEHQLNKAQSTIKSVKHDIKKIRNQAKHSDNYIMLFGVDIWNRGGSPIQGTIKRGSKIYYPRYFVLSLDPIINGALNIKDPDYYDVINGCDCHFTKSFLEDKLCNYICYLEARSINKVSNLFSNHEGIDSELPIIMSLSGFKSEFGSK